LDFAHTKVLCHNEQSNIVATKNKYNIYNIYLLCDGRVIESRGNVSRDVLVTLLITVVLGDVVKVITTDNDGTLHLGRGNNTSQDTTLDVNFTNVGALLVNVGTILGFLGGLETVTDFLEPTLVTLLGVLGVLENTSLLLESLFGLL
jgi:hypothetical protein